MDTDQNPLKLKINKTQITCNATLRVKGFMHTGKYQIQLVVSDEFGNTSAPFQHNFTVNPPVGWRQKLQHLIAAVFNRL